MVSVSTIQNLGCEAPVKTQQESWGCGWSACLPHTRPRVPSQHHKAKQSKKKKKIKILGKYSQAYSLVIFWDNFLTWGQP
jgi:hypothetical protein